MELRLTFLASGDNFDINTCIHQLNHKKFNLGNEYSNTISFSHKNEFCQYYDEQYELDFYELIVNNIDILKENNADDFVCLWKCMLNLMNNVILKY